MVYEDTNPRYHGLISRFGEATGVPVILNTSFNLRGEPIVTTPENALNTFTNSGLDLLVLDSLIVRKTSDPQTNSEVTERQDGRPHCIHWRRDDGRAYGTQSGE